jgi:mono/diheme cytochrome c family protein
MMKSRRVRMTARVIVPVVAFILVGVAPAWAQRVSTPSEDPSAGAKVFDTRGCAKCHSVNGVGGKIGPDLAKVSRPRTFYDLAAGMWNHLPNMTGKMRELGITRPSLDSREAGNLAGFLFMLNYFDTPGNLEAGRKLFTEKRCVVCHTYQGAGGAVGPDLDHLVQFRSPIDVASAMWNHGPQMAERMKERGVERPSFTADELRDLIAYLAPSSAGAKRSSVHALPGRPEAGRRLFAGKRCVECHAVGGAGGRVGPDLIDRGVRQSPMEFAATIWNKAPAMAAAMRSHAIAVPQLSPAEMADIVAYLYSVRYFGSGGSIPNGYAVATSKGCFTCHALRGERGKQASDLARAKGLDSPVAVLAGLWNHAVVTPPSVGSQKAEWPLFTSQEMADLIAMLQSLGQKATPKAN